MPTFTPSELKKALVREGFEVYRTQGNRIVLADRVRNNLIMDSGVAACVGESLGVRVVLKAQANDFPDESAEDLFERARGMAGALIQRGYEETTTNTVPIFDPGDRSKTLDTWYEVGFERKVDGPPELVDELRFALSLDKTVPARARS